MATVTKKGKKWYAIFTDENGKQRWKAGFHDKAETQKYARRLEDEAAKIRNGEIDPAADVARAYRARTITEHLADFKAKMEAAGRTGGHIAYTIRDIERLISFGGIRHAAEITATLIDKWVLSCKTDHVDDDGKIIKADANKTINRRVASVQAFLRNLQEAGGVTSYTLRAYAKLPTHTVHRTRHARALTSVEVATLVSDSRIPQQRRDLYLFASKTGLRLSECRSAMPAWIDLSRKTLTVPANIAKAKRDQTVTAHPDVLALVERISKSPTTPLFSMPTKQHVNNHLRADCTLTGIDPKDVSFHGFRHSFCTSLARANVHPALLQTLARHADLKTTLGYYVHLRRDDEAAAIALL